MVSPEHELAELDKLARESDFDSARQMILAMKGYALLSDIDRERIRLHSQIAGLQQLLSAETARADNATRLSNALQDKVAAAAADVRRLDSGIIMTQERDELGESYRCERRGLNLRAMIDEAIEAQRR